jgi:hypothetical protein
MTNFITWIRSWEITQEQLNNETIDNTANNIKLLVWWILEWNKYNKKNSVKISNREQLSDIFENSHLTVELELAKMFWVKNTDKIIEDYRQPMTVTDVLNEAQELWEQELLMAA